jgi:hypothetical protein
LSSTNLGHRLTEQLLAQSGHPNIRSLFVAAMIDADSGVNEFMHFFELSDPQIMENEYCVEVSASARGYPVRHLVSK